MSDAAYIWLVTIDGDHRRRCGRAEVDPAVATIVRQQISEALAGHDVEIYPGHGIKAVTAGGALLVTVFAATGASLCTIAVARNSLQSSKLWPMLESPAPAPPPPWCAVKIYPPIGGSPDALAWLADLERCIAWAWVDKQVRPR